MFYVANKSRESETSAYYNLYAFVVILFFNLLKTTQYLAQYLAIYCNMQYVYRYSLLAILYCVAIVNIAIYQYINVLFHPYDALNVSDWEGLDG